MADEGTYVLDAQVGYLLRRAHQRATAIFQAEIGDDQLTPTQWAALVKLAEHEALSQNHLGRLTAMDPATAQGVIRRLKRRGLIARVDDDGDRRRKPWRLTAAGEALVGGHLGDGHRISATILAPSTPPSAAPCSPSSPASAERPARPVPGGRIPRARLACQPRRARRAFFLGRFKERAARWPTAVSHR